MAYQPTYPSPYMETIDVNQEGGNIFKCLINPKDTIIGATLNIYSNMDNSLVKAIELEDDLFPFTGNLSDNSWLSCRVNSEDLANKREYKWSITLTYDEIENISSGRILSVATDLKTVDVPHNPSIYTRIKSGVDNGDAYYIVLGSERAEIVNVGYTVPGGEMHVNLKAALSTSYAEGCVYDIEMDNVTLTSPEYYFKARTTPEVTFNPPSSITNSTHTFTATYSQEQRVGVTYFQYDLYSKGEIVASSGKVFGKNISYTFNNLLNDTDYVVKLTVVNDDNVEVCREHSFYVDYPITATVIDPIIESNNSRTCINVDFTNNATIPSTLINVSNIDYEIYSDPDGDPNYVVVAEGKVRGFDSNWIDLEPYDNIAVGMYVKIGEETIRITGVSYIGSDFIRVILGSMFSTVPTIESEDSEGSDYKILSRFNGIHLAENQAILWDKVGSKPLSLPNKSTQVVHWHGEHGFKGTILEKINLNNREDLVTVSYDGQKFVYKIRETLTGEHNPYEGAASAIAENDEHSAIVNVVNYEKGSSSITLSGSDLIKEGNAIQMGNKYANILSIKPADEPADENIIAELDRPISYSTEAVETCVVYDDNYLYVLNDTDELSDDDILIDNDLAYKYWWLIVITSNEVKFKKSVPFTESEV